MSGPFSLTPIRRKKLGVRRFVSRECIWRAHPSERSPGPEWGCSDRDFSRSQGITPTLRDAGVREPLASTDNALYDP